MVGTTFSSHHPFVVGGVCCALCAAHCVRLNCGWLLRLRACYALLAGSRHSNEPQQQHNLLQPNMNGLGRHAVAVALQRAALSARQRARLRRSEPYSNAASPPPPAMSATASAGPFSFFFFFFFRSGVPWP